MYGDLRFVCDGNDIHSRTDKIVVRDVRAAHGGFEVTARDGESDTEECQFFEHVIVATGHFSFPHVPHYPGFESFNGRILFMPSSYRRDEAAKQKSFPPRGRSPWEPAALNLATYYLLVIGSLTGLCARLHAFIVACGCGCGH